jgi:hypothetical protein
MAGIANASKNQQQNRFVFEFIPRLGLTYARANVQFALLPSSRWTKAGKKNKSLK